MEKVYIVGYTGIGKIPTGRLIELAESTNKNTYFISTREGSQTKNVNYPISQAKLFDSPNIETMGTGSYILAVKRSRKNYFSDIVNIMAITRIPEVIEYEEMIKEINNYQALPKFRKDYIGKNRLTPMSNRKPYDIRSQIMRHKHLR